MNTHINVHEYTDDRFDHEVDDETNESEIWPPEVEEAFQEAYELYPSTGRTKLKAEDGRLYGRNELISRHIYEVTGKVRTRKQVSSHIQVLIKKHNRFAQPEYLRTPRPESLRTASAIHMSELMGASSRTVSSESANLFKSVKKSTATMKDAYPSPTSSRKASSSSTGISSVRETRSKSKPPRLTNKPSKKYDFDDVSDSESDYDLIEPAPVDRLVVLLEAANYINAYDKFINATKPKPLDIDLSLKWRFLNFDSHPTVLCSIEAPTNQLLNVFVEIYCGSDLVSADKVPTMLSRRENSMTLACDMKVVESAVLFIAKTVETLTDAAARKAHIDQYRFRLFVANNDGVLGNGGDDRYYGLKFAAIGGKEALDFYRVRVDQA